MAENVQSSTSLRHYAEILWRRKWIIVAAAATAPLLFAVFYPRPPRE